MGQCVMKDCGFEYNKNPQCETQKLKGFLKERLSQKKKIKTTEDVEIDKNQIPDFENNYISEPIYEKSSLPIKKKSSKNKNEVFSLIKIPTIPTKINIDSQASTNFSSKKLNSSKNFDNISKNNIEGKNNNLQPIIENEKNIFSMVSILDDNTPDFNDFDFKKKFMKEEKILEDIYSEVEISQEIDNLNEFEKQFPEEIITKSGGKSSKEKYL